MPSKRSNTVIVAASTDKHNVEALVNAGVVSKQATSGSSYGQILRASSILGGTQVAVYLISLVKTKAAAVILGPSGVGLIGLYMSATSMISIAAGLGLTVSGVQAIAEDVGKEDRVKVAQTFLVLRRLCWVTGVAGWLLTIALAWPLSLWIFGSSEKMYQIMLLGSTIFMGSVAAAQITLLRGMRRIGDLAQINLLCVVSSAGISIALYMWAGMAGIVPALIVSSIAALWIHLWYGRKVRLQRCSLSWVDTFRGAGPLLRLGVAFMWSALLITLVAFVTRALVVKELGVDQNGLYQAAWAMSGMFSGFVLGAMGVDFYPRLSGVASDNESLKRLVNEQTEVGYLLALPGILGTLIFAPVLVRVLYTSEFFLAVDLLPWFLSGVLVQLASWPLGYTLLAKRESLCYALVETVINTASLIMVVWFLRQFGLVGAAAAFTGTQVVHVLVFFTVLRSRANFSWGIRVIRVMLICACFMIAGIAVHYGLDGWNHLAAGVLILLLASLFSVRRLLGMVNLPPGVVRLVQRIPFAASFAKSFASAAPAGARTQTSSHGVER